MKKITLPSSSWTKSLFVLLALVFGQLFISCSPEDKEEIVLEEEITEFDLSTQEGRVAYTEYHLKTLATSVGKLSFNPEFRQKLYTEVEKKNLGEYSVLVEGLANISKEQSNYAREMAFISKENGRDFMQSLNAFKDVSEYVRYPQVYIPYYENQKSKVGEGYRQAEFVSPYIIIATGDTGKENAEYPGYRLDDSGILIEQDFLISEEFAMENEVWVFSLSEFEAISDEATVTEGNRILWDSWDAVITGDMRCRCHKEEWAYGASEVHFIAALTNYNLALIKEKHYGGGDFQGGKIFDFSREAVKKGNWKGVNFLIQEDWESIYPDHEFIFYVVFEYDPWPVDKRNAVFSLADGSTYTVKYRSSDSSYDQYDTHRIQLLNFYRGNSCVDYSIFGL